MRNIIGVMLPIVMAIVALALVLLLQSLGVHLLHGAGIETPVGGALSLFVAMVLVLGSGYALLALLVPPPTLSKAVNLDAKARYEPIKSDESVRSAEEILAGAAANGDLSERALSRDPVMKASIERIRRVHHS